LADSVSIILQLLSNKLFLGLPGLESLAVIIHEQFNPDAVNTSANASDPSESIPDEDTEEFQKTERLTFLRWLWFILGTLPPTIKLFAMEGLPWTKTWGAMFLSSWIINESLVIFATFTQSIFTIFSDGRISWPGYDRTTHLVRWAQIKRLLAYVEKGLAATALISHLVVSNSTYRSVWRLLCPSGDYPLSSTIAEEFRWKSYPYRVMNPRYTFSVTTILLLTMGLATFFPRSVKNFLAVSYVAWFLFSCQLMLVTTFINSIAYYGVYSTPSGGFVSSTIVVFFFSTITVASFIPLLWWCCMQSVKLGRILLISFSEYHGSTRRLKVDYVACLALAFFMNTVVACVLGYCYIFDPTNTYNPVWTGVFG
jgi:hypothetical protein